MKKLILISIVTFVSILYSCEDSKNPVITDVKTGNITGILDIYDSDDNSGAFVSLKGTNIKTTTDYAGKWTLTNVEPGVYDIIFSKPGYDTTEVYGFPFPGNGTAYVEFRDKLGATKLSRNYPSPEWAIYKPTAEKPKIVSVNVELNSYNSNSGDTILAIVMKEYPREGRMFFLFFKKSPDLSRNSYDEISEISYFSFDYDSITKKIYFILDSSNWELNKKLKKWGSGTRVYAIMYPCISYETDLRNGQIRWLGMGKQSNIVDFVVP